MAKNKPSKPQAVKAPPEPLQVTTLSNGDTIVQDGNEIRVHPATVVTVEPLEGSGDSVAEEINSIVVDESVIERVEAEIDKMAHDAAQKVSDEAAPKIVEAIISAVGTDTTPVVPATAEKLVFCDPPGEWRKL